MNGCATLAGFEPADAKETLNRWIGHEFALLSERSNRRV